MIGCLVAQAFQLAPELRATNAHCSMPPLPGAVVSVPPLMAWNMPSLAP